MLSFIFWHNKKVEQSYNTTPQIKKIIRGAAKKFGISKSTVHKDVSERLQKINPCLALEVRKILDENKAERHIRGGMATKLKYSNEKEQHVG